MKAAKDQLQSKEKELRQLMEQLQTEREMSSEQKERLVAEIQSREIQVSEMRQQIELRTEETNRLQRQIDEARMREPNKHINAFNIKEVDLDEASTENGHIGTGIF